MSIYILGIEFFNLDIHLDASEIEHSLLDIHLDALEIERSILDMWKI